MFNLGQLLEHKETKERVIFMGINPDSGKVIFLKKKKENIIEEKKNANIFTMMYGPVYNHKKELDLGTFCLRTGLMGSTYGYLSIEESDKKSIEKIKKLAWCTLNE